MRQRIYYMLGLLIVTVWGTSYVSSKVIIDTISPIDTAFYRAVIALILFCILCPKFQKPKSFKEELPFILLGIFGGTSYFVLQNIGLSYSTTTNASLLIGTVPTFTAILAHFFTQNQKLNKNTLLGFLISFIGMFLVIFNGQFVLKLNPLGDILTLGAAVSWAIYSLILNNKISPNLSIFIVTTKTYFYFVLTMIPVLFMSDFHFSTAIFESKILLNLIYLGIFSSGFCMLLWTKIVRELGAVISTSFVYLQPLIASVTAVLLIHENVTLTSIFGGTLIVLGTYFAQKDSLKSTSAETIAEI